MAGLFGLAALVAFTPLPGSNLLLFLMVGVVAAWLRGASRGGRPAAVGMRPPTA